MEREETYEPEYIKSLSTKAKIRYLNVHSQQSNLRKVITKYSTHYRKGKSYYNYMIRLPKQWADGLEFEHYDEFLWSIISYDPVILQLRKLEGDKA